MIRFDVVGNFAAGQPTPVNPPRALWVNPAAVMQLQPAGPDETAATTYIVVGNQQYIIKGMAKDIAASLNMADTSAWINERLAELVTAINWK